MTVHELKCMPPHFQHVWDDLKLFEVRKDDRGFQPGDQLLLREWADATGYSGRMARRSIIYVLRDGTRFGLQDGYVVLGLAPPTAQ